MERLCSLEALVKELRGQLEQANPAAARPAGTGLSGVNTPGSSPSNCECVGTGDQMEASPITETTSVVQEQLGRLVLQDSSQSRYVSSDFWSRVSDEVS
jgi:hypothetical protein